MARKKTNLIVALDVRTLQEARRLVGRLLPAVRYFKVGSELFTACGPEVIRMIRRKGGKVFLDLKFHDIPNTVASAVRSAIGLGVFMLNIHTLGGRRMMAEAAAAAKRSGKKVYLIGVTVLTSMKDGDLRGVGIRDSTADQVVKLARLAKASGLDGVVASGREAASIRARCGKNFLIVTPGVRPSWAAAGDQKRIVTPRKAMEAGSDFIVVGRPVIADKNPLEAARRILRECRLTLKGA